MCDEGWKKLSLFTELFCKATLLASVSGAVFDVILSCVDGCCWHYFVSVFSAGRGDNGRSHSALRAVFLSSVLAAALAIESVYYFATSPPYWVLLLGHIGETLCTVTVLIALVTLLLEFGRHIALCRVGNFAMECATCNINMEDIPSLDIEHGGERLQRTYRSRQMAKCVLMWIVFVNTCWLYVMNLFFWQNVYLENGLIILGMLCNSFLFLAAANCFHILVSHVLAGEVAVLYITDYNLFQHRTQVRSAYENSL